MTYNLPWCWVLILAVLMLFARKWLPWLGQLPGDFTVHRGNLTVFIPLGTSLLIGIVLSILAAVFAKR
jgi:hypothetical protein